MSERALLSLARSTMHVALLREVLVRSVGGIPSNADKDNTLSCELANGILEAIGQSKADDRLAGQMSGSVFEQVVHGFLLTTFPALAHLRPGRWEVRQLSPTRARSRNVIRETPAPRGISQFEQYAHLHDLELATRASKSLAAILGNDYLITPDIVVLREPETDEVINSHGIIVDDTVALRASLRAGNSTLRILHASVSCKWTLRSDRAQNARSEALNLIRNRKGRLPHIVVVTAEPLPSRLASLALGTGDIDCVYHFALPELQAAVNRGTHEDAKDMLAIMVEGKRIRDIGDLPLDLAI